MKWVPACGDGVDGSAGLEEDFDDGVVGVLDGVHEGGHLVGAAGFEVSPAVEDEAHEFGVTGADGGD